MSFLLSALAQRVPCRVVVATVGASSWFPAGGTSVGVKPRKTHSADDLEKLMVGVAKNGAVRFSGVPSLSTAFVASARVALEGDGPQGTLLHLIPDRAASLACFFVSLKRREPLGLRVPGQTLFRIPGLEKGTAVQWASFP